MRPTFANLAAAKGGHLTVNLPLASGSGAGLAMRRAGVRLGGAGKSLSLDVGSSDAPGMWVHYLPTRASYGESEGGESWGASGPFSGCQIIIGKREGRIYLAHIAQESGSGANSQWSDRGWRDEVWGRWKVGAPSEKFNCNSIVFVDWSKGANPNTISVVRVDLKTASMGGFDKGPMDIFNVKEIVKAE
jgi:hypothetical protein